MRFAKGHGTENDFVILLDPDGSEGLTAGLAARLCDRRAGIGADGVLRAVRSADGADGEAEWFMDYRNADGTLAEMCGNGIRVFARYLVERGLAEGPEFTVGTRSGSRRIRMAAGGVTVDMGGVAVLGRGTAMVGGRPQEGLRVSVGNPHLACLVDAPLAGFDLSRPPGLDPAQFPGGGNVELVRVTGPRSVSMRVHERGSGETRSCGTGAVAAAAAAAAAGGRAVGDGEARDEGIRAARDGGAWEVTVPGGVLTVTLDADCAWLTGPAVVVADGELDPAWLAASRRDHGPAAVPAAPIP
jgi:diaminopimelate epimerase